jgi:hypothetical protein
MIKPNSVIAMAAVAAVAGVAFYVWRRGGIAPAAQAIGAGAVNTAGNVASGAVGAVGASVGLPTPSETTTDPAVARWIIDNHGYFTASKWSGAPALLKAAFLPEGTGTPPPPGSAAAKALGAPASGGSAYVPSNYNTAGIGQSGSGSFSDGLSDPYAYFQQRPIDFGYSTGSADGW